MDLGLFVSWNKAWKRTKAFLEEKKVDSQGGTGLLDSTDIGREFLHQSAGKPPNYRYQLQFPEYRIYFAISDELRDSPNVYVTIKAEVLWHEGISTILELLELDLDSFGGTIECILPSRCDLCVDYKISPPPTLSFIQIHRVSRSHKNRPYLDGDILETFYCGSANSPVQLRIYDKGKEIQKTNKLWFSGIWETNETQDVWRVEFQLRRAFLHQYQISTLNDLWEKIGAIWNYLTSEWFLLRVPDNDKTERRTVHPWWLEVQECRKRFGTMSDAKRTFNTSGVPSIHRTLAHILGRFVSIAVQSGMKNRKEALEHLGQLINDNIDDEKFAYEYRKKSIKLGYRGRLGGSEYEIW